MKVITRVIKTIHLLPSDLTNKNRLLLKSKKLNVWSIDMDMFKSSVIIECEDATNIFFSITKDDAKRLMK